MAVEGQGREAEEQDGIGNDTPPPRDVDGGILAPGRLVPLPRPDLLAEHRSSLFLEGEPAGRVHAVDHGGEDQGARAARLHGEVGQLGLSSQLLPDANRLVKPEPLAREHPPGQRHGWDHSRVEGTAIGP